MFWMKKAPRIPRLRNPSRSPRQSAPIDRRFYPAVVILSCLVACAHYSTTSGMIGGIRTVGVPIAENETAEFDIGERLSQTTGEAFVSDGRLRVVDEESSDAVLLMTVLSLADRPFTYTASEETEQYRFAIQVRAELIANDDEEVLLELARLDGWGTYAAGLADDEDGGRDDAIDAAFEMIIEEIVDRITASW
jgi:hypothetical protein